MVFYCLCEFWYRWLKNPLLVRRMSHIKLGTQRIPTEKKAGQPRWFTFEKRPQLYHRQTWALSPSKEKYVKTLSLIEQLGRRDRDQTQTNKDNGVMESIYFLFSLAWVWSPVDGEGRRVEITGGPPFLVKTTHGARQPSTRRGRPTEDNIFV